MTTTPGDTTDQKRRKRCWFHTWKTDGLTGPLSTLETCSKCGKRREFNGFTGDYTYYPPIKEDQTNE